MITLAATAALWIPLTRLMAGKYRHLAWLVAVALPFSALVNLAVKTPLLRTVVEASGVSTSGAVPPLWFLLFSLLLAPVTEEAIKLLPALARPVRRYLAEDRGAGLWAGLFLGVGFGLGEIGYLAWRLTGTPAVAGVPVWQFTGFLTERLYVTFGHGILTAVAVYGLARGWLRGLRGYAYAVLLHATLNVGALLYQLKLAPVQVAGLWGMGVFVGLILLFMWLQGQNRLDAAPEPEVVFFQRES